MLVRNLDFLSSPPQMYILQQKTNKTLFGGILFILYIIIMLIISFIFILNYALNDKYIIEYSFYKDFENPKKVYNINEDLNPQLNFSFNFIKITPDLDQVEADEFYIVDNNFNFLDINSPISSTPSNMSFLIIHLCFDCSEEINNDTNFAYIVNISYSGYKIDHQNNNIPLRRNSDKYPYYKELYFNFVRTTFYEVNWNIIKYKEERGMLGLFDNLLDKKYEFTGIDIGIVEQAIIEKTIEIENPEFPFFKIRILAFINMYNNHKEYIEYKRSKKSILDVLADIGASFSTLFSVFTFIFNFYSKNFDNYKIIEETLSIPRNLNTTNNKIFKANSIKFEDISFNKKDPTDINDITSFDSFKTTPSNLRRMNISKRGN